MKKTFALLHDLNRDLIGEHAKRTANHQRLVAALKSVNQIVQKAANIRGKRFPIPLLDSLLLLSFLFFNCDFAMIISISHS